MGSNRFSRINLTKIQTPCHIIDKKSIEDNLKILNSVQKRTGAKILLALKGYAAFSTFPLIKKYLAGVCAGSLNETKLGKEEFGKEVHSYFPAFIEDEFQEVQNLSSHIIFNSFSQFEKYKSKIKNKKIGLRVNPEKSTSSSKFGVYDPCIKNSRLGATLKSLKGKKLYGITGLHFHALCEQGSEDLEIVLRSFEEKFDYLIKNISWVNFGGGHHITKKDYNINKLCSLITNFKKKYPNIKEVYLEPGEAVVLNAGILVSSVLDIVKNEKNIAILDSSVETHFPDVLITKCEKEPYIPEVLGAKSANKLKHNYLLAGVSCAAGDIIGKYSFNKLLKPGNKIIFLDTAHYSMVKTSTFCGVNLPSIYIMEKTNKLKKIREFSYTDYKKRLS